MAIKRKELERAMKERRNGESLHDAIRRLRFDGEIETPKLVAPKRIVSAAGVKAMLKKRKRLCGAGVAEAIEEEVLRIIDTAIECARKNGRKTLQPEDVTGESCRMETIVARAAAGRRRAKRGA